MRHAAITSTSMAPSTSGSQAPCGLGGAGRKKETSNTMKKATTGIAFHAGQPQRPRATTKASIEVTTMVRSSEAVGLGELLGLLERQNHGDDRGEEHEVDGGDIDLAPFGGRGVWRLRARPEAEVRGLMVRREGAGDHRLAGDDGGEGGEDRDRAGRRAARGGRRCRERR